MREGRGYGENGDERKGRIEKRKEMMGKMKDKGKEGWMKEKK